MHLGVALPFAEELWREVQAIDHLSPFRQMITPGGQIMSVSMTNCGTLGWVSDRKGYRYQCGDPLTGRAWPVMPKSFATSLDLQPQLPDTSASSRTHAS